jgi:hypothetical protein
MLVHRNKDGMLELPDIKDRPATCTFAEIAEQLEQLIGSVDGGDDQYRLTLCGRLLIGYIY